MDKSRTYIVIPAKDEGKRIGPVLERIKTNGYDNTIVVDDCSTDDTLAISKKLAKHFISHKINLGPGGATRSGIDFALKKGADYIVTLDADQQHDPDEITKLVLGLNSEEADMIIGSRFLQKDNVIPTSRRAYNKIANVISRIITGINLTDSQSGFRAMTRDFAIDNPIENNGFEFCIEALKFANRKGYKVKEIPISVLYTKETLKKGQNLWVGFRTLARIVMGQIHPNP